eukprot:TRINITY_DN5368_c0_g1_i3.p1 TRINITY_DN5368_c0_g1~~TRINITY_DN5368_c0_g1_i3.p1  ORF type:complete len:418 (-),score=117.60 TRINITY_DN5368_c0_g1_i3:315-1568(-)
MRTKGNMVIMKILNGYDEDFEKDEAAPINSIKDENGDPANKIEDNTTEQKNAGDEKTEVADEAPPAENEKKQDGYDEDFEKDEAVVDNSVANKEGQENQVEDNTADQKNAGDKKNEITDEESPPPLPPAATERDNKKQGRYMDDPARYKLVSANSVRDISENHEVEANISIVYEKSHEYEDMEVADGAQPESGGLQNQEFLFDTDQSIVDGTRIAQNHQEPSQAVDTNGHQPNDEDSRKPQESETEAKGSKDASQDVKKTTNSQYDHLKQVMQEDDYEYAVDLLEEKRLLEAEVIALKNVFDKVRESEQPSSGAEHLLEILRTSRTVKSDVIDEAVDVLVKEAPTTFQDFLGIMASAKMSREVEHLLEILRTSRTVKSDVIDEAVDVLVKEAPTTFQDFLGIMASAKMSREVETLLE